MGFPGGLEGSRWLLLSMQETQIRSLGREDPQEKEMATHSSILAWRIPWMEEPGSLQSTGSQSRTRLSDFTHSMEKQTNRHREQTYGHGERRGEGEMYGESNTETYITVCKIDSQEEFALWLRKLKQGLCISLEGWDGAGDGREVQKGGDICVPVADSG